MDFKTFWKESRWAFVIKMCLCAVAAIIVLTMLVMALLKVYTRHGQEVEVPDFSSMYIEEAEVLAKQSNLTIQVVDSTYTKKVPLGCILDQNPAIGSKTKVGRPIYVVINAKQVRQVPLPAVKDMSYRQAESTLITVGLAVGDVVWEPSEYNNLVLDVRYQGKTVEAGTRLGEGSKVTLVVGEGGGTEQVPVPDLATKTLDEAREALLAQRLILGGIYYDVEPNGNESDYVVYNQSKQAGQYTVEGSHIDLYMTTDREKAASAAQEEQKDEFFD